MLHPIRAYRHKQELTLAAFAAKAGTSAGTISRIEHGTLRPTLELLRRLSEATDGEVTADAIIASTPRAA